MGKKVSFFSCFLKKLKIISVSPLKISIIVCSNKKIKKGCFMLKKIFSATVALIVLNGCVGTMKIVKEESSIQEATQSHLYSKPIEESTSSIREK